MTPAQRHKLQVAKQPNQSEPTNDLEILELEFFNLQGQLKNINSKAAKIAFKKKHLAKFRKNLLEVLKNNSEPKEFEKFTLVWLFDVVENFSDFKEAFEIAKEADKQNWWLPETFKRSLSIFLVDFITVFTRKQNENLTDDETIEMQEYFASLYDLEIDLPDMLKASFLKYYGIVAFNNKNETLAQELLEESEKLGGGVKTLINKLFKKT